VSGVGALDETCREIWRYQPGWAREHQPGRERVERLIELTDAMVGELEQLNLDGIERVEAAWKPRLSALFSALPFSYLPWLRAFPSPTEVLDLVFDVQAQLLDMKLARAHRRN
jgi:hypothetical protein